jgi:hypothetical protein
MNAEHTMQTTSSAHILPEGFSVIKVSRFLARIIWAWMLWLVRRPLMKRLQALSPMMLPKSMRARGIETMKRQNAFARKHGLTWLTMVVAFFLISVGTAWTYQAAVFSVESGFLNPPSNMVAGGGPSFLRPF